MSRGKEVVKPKTLIAMMDILDIDLQKDELDSFQVFNKPLFYRLIGEKDILLKFKEKHNISNPVLSWQDTWQLME